MAGSGPLRHEFQPYPAKDGGTRCFQCGQRKDHERHVKAAAVRTP